MRKRDSLRRWKARCLLGRAVPKLSIVEHSLDRWFSFILRDFNTHYYFAVEKDQS